MRTHQIKQVPSAVSNWFERNFEGCEFVYYTYKGTQEKIYACNVYKEGGFFHNATQAPLTWFEEQDND